MSTLRTTSSPATVPLSTQTASPSQRILGDSWYVSSVDDLCESLSQLIATRCNATVRRLAEKPGLIRNLCLFWLGRSYDRIVCTQRSRGLWLFLVLEALVCRGRKRVILLEFMPAPVRGRGPHRWLQISRRLAMTYSIRRCLLLGHVLTEWERGHYSSTSGIPRERFVFVPWPLRRAADPVPSFGSRQSRHVVSSGRRSCDWQTLWRAAEGQNWQLTIVCTAHDEERIRADFESIGATVLCDISQAEHQRLLQSVAVYVISLREEYLSSGQIRVMNAIRAGAPLVASSVLGLEGYVSDEETALCFDPGDHLACRRTVDRLLADPGKQTELATRAFHVVGERTFEKYLLEIRRFVHDTIAATDDPIVNVINSEHSAADFKMPHTPAA